MNTHDAVTKIISSCLMIDVDQITDTAHIMEDLGADSIAVADIIMSLEDEYNVVIEEEHLDQITTIRDIVNFIEQNS